MDRIVLDQDMAYAESLRIDKHKEKLKKEQRLRMKKIVESRNKLLSRYHKDMQKKVRQIVQLKVDCWGTTELNLVLLPRHTLNTLVAVILAELEVITEIEAFVDPVCRRVLSIPSHGSMSLRKLGILLPQRLIAKNFEPK